MGRSQAAMPRGTMLVPLLAGMLPAALSVPFDSWHIPEYCSTPRQMETRQIQPLSAQDEARFSLLQVQAVIRHGARVPADGSFCWEGREPFQCSLTSLMAAQGAENPPNTSDTGTLTNAALPRLYRKVYDWNSTEDPASNVLPGTCLLGQLIAPGIEQQKTNGKHLRSYYFQRLFGGAGGTAAAVGEGGTPAMPKDVYVRSDDMQRTLISGQTLFDAFFPLPASTKVKGEASVVRWHTRDLARSTLYPNTRLCPKLSLLRAQAVKSNEALRARNASEAHRKLTALWQGASGAGSRFEWKNALDCLMTARCNGPLGGTTRRLPEAISADERVFNSTLDYLRMVWRATYGFGPGSDARYSKLAMRPLLRVVEREMLGQGSTQRKKFVLHSGHDTTVLPLLAALGGDAWDGEWPPYASLVVFELYAVRGREASAQSEDLHFRILYQGKPRRMAGCKTDVCPLNIFIAHIASFTDASLGGGCEMTAADQEDLAVLEGVSGASSKVSVGATVGVAVACSVSSAALTLLFRRRSEYAAIR